VSIIVILPGNSPVKTLSYMVSEAATIYLSTSGYIRSALNISCAYINHSMKKTEIPKNMTIFAQK
jgi:hypothetical protein